jgi:hypothetical protein
MTKVKLLSAVVLAAAALTTPAMARGSFVGTEHTSSAYARAVPAERSADVACVRAPRVGAFASQPWANPPCEPNTAF